MKRICLYGLSIILLFAAIGCACGRNNAPTGPENPNVTVVVDDPAAKNALAYFQAHTGYLPTVVLLNDETLQKTAEDLAARGESAERADVLKAICAGATCLLLKDEAIVQEYEALGFVIDNEALRTLTASYRIENADQLGVTVVQMPSGSETNLDALKALVSWLTGAEAKHLADNPDLLK